MSAFGEQFLVRKHPSWKSRMMLAVATRLLIVVVVFDAAMYVLMETGKLSRPLGVLAAVAFTLAGAWLCEQIRRTTVYEITQHDVRHRWGILVRRETSIPLTHVASVQPRQSLWERPLRTGDVTFGSGATDASQDDVVFNGIHDPRGVMGVYRRALAELRSGGGMHAGYAGGVVTDLYGTAGHPQQPSPYGQASPYDQQPPPAPGYGYGDGPPPPPGYGR